jgi:polysaccharide export outer membrane protein
MMHKKIISTLFLFLLLFALQGCKINSNILFKSPKGEYAAIDSVPMRPATEYKISVDDKLSFTMSTNEGALILESMSGISTTTKSNSAHLEYIVRKNGKVELPILGEVPVAGLSISACEDTLQRLFSKQYQNPFVQVNVTNQRVLVFPGNGSDAKVIPLVNSNTTLMEAIAQAGGITERGKANTIKLMRKENGKRQVYTLDLSTMDGLAFADMIVQANDYIYIEPNPDLAKGAIKEIAPILSIFSSVLIIFTVISNI